MKILVVVLVTLFISAIMFLLLILTNNKLECYFFYHKEWILWERVIENFNEKIFEYKFRDGTILYNITIDNIKYKIYYWYDKRISLHNGDFCLSSYDEYHQKKVKELFKKELSK